MPGRNDDDEQELINSEFESMVADLNLDQSSERTYLDDLDDIEAAEKSYRNPEQLPRGIHTNASNIFTAIKRWFNRNNGPDDDGARI